MKSYKRLLAALFALSLLLSFSAAAFAVTYSGNNVRHGLSPIQAKDTLTLPNNTRWATLTATWGVRVKFLDWRDSEIKNVLVPEGGWTSTPNPPAREGYIFTGWSLIDDSAGGRASLNGDSVNDVYGPGPLVYKANYRTVRADGQTNGTITLLNTTHSEDYAGYKIFDAEINPGNSDAIIYTITEDSHWFDFVKDYFDLTELREVPGEGVDPKIIYKVDPKDGFDPKTFSEDLPTVGITPDLANQTPNRDGVITWDEVPFGYYAITSSLGSWVTVNTNNPFATVIDKNQGPQLDKNIIEDGEKKKVNDASFGDNVIFDIEVTASNYKATELITYYHIKDTIGDGFDYDFTDGSNVTVTVTGTQETVTTTRLTPVSSLEALEAADSGYVFLHEENSRSFEVVVKWATLNANGDLMPISPNEWNHIDVTYSAAVNNSAVIAGSGNPNTASLTYDKSSGFDPENPPTEEPTPNENTEPGNSDITTTYVYALAIEKVDAANKTHLPGVRFTTDDFRTTKTTVDGIYEVIADGDTTSTAAEYFEVPESGFILIKGLASGDYNFKEIYTLPGYNLLPAEGLDITIPSADSGIYTSAGTVYETECAEIKTVANSTGIELPSTGGMGTKLFVIIGSVTLLTTVVILVSKKRMYNETI